MKVYLPQMLSCLYTGTFIGSIKTYENAVFWLDNQCVLFLNSTLDNRELYQFQTISRGHYTCGIDFPT